MRLLAIIGALAILLGIGAAIFFFGGFFDVAESVPNPAPIDWALATVRAESVARHAAEAPPPPNNLSDPATIKAGARAYATVGCVHCHGGPPDANWSKFSEGLVPIPADLKVLAKTRTPAELFWAIKSGIKFTGMPSFGLAGASDDQLWSIVAFVKNLPSMSDADYKDWTPAGQ
jgi:mono/diheme cytochrome c family protein